MRPPNGLSLVDMGPVIPSRHNFRNSAWASLFDATYFVVYTLVHPLSISDVPIHLAPGDRHIMYIVSFVFSITTRVYVFSRTWLFRNYNQYKLRLPPWTVCIRCVNLLSQMSRQCTALASRARPRVTIKASFYTEQERARIYRAISP